MRALALATLLALAACGQKGNLYLPDEDADPVTSVRTIPADPAAAPEVAAPEVAAPEVAAPEAPADAAAAEERDREKNPRGD